MSPIVMNVFNGIPASTLEGHVAHKKVTTHTGAIQCTDITRIFAAYFALEKFSIIKGTNDTFHSRLFNRIFSSNLR